MLKYLGSLQYFAITNNVTKNNLLCIFIFLKVYLHSQFLEVILLSKKINAYVVSLGIVISFSGCFLASTMNSLIIRTPTGCPTIRFNSDTNYAQLAQNFQVKDSVL